ncbi:MAG: hypothetical protein WBF79_15080 [Rhodococcus sp. (in: high G+C Gram-positive bacteria)]
MPLTYTDRDGADIDAETWRQFRAEDTYRTVDRDYVTVGDGRALVTTQWHGLTVHTNSGDLAWKFITLVCAPGDADGWTKNWDTLADAQFGHREVLTAIREGRCPA